MTGGSFSRTPGTAGLLRAGGGDLSRGDTGHLGLSLDVSEMTEGFCGTGARMVDSDREGGGSDGVVAVEIWCRGVVAEGVGILDLDLVGLRSCVLFFLDLVPVPAVDERVILPGFVKDLDGEESRDTSGDVFADVHLEFWVSMFALEVTEVSLSIERKLVKLASRLAGPEWLFAMVRTLCGDWKLLIEAGAQVPAL
jgi:hypothetical protein